MRKKINLGYLLKRHEKKKVILRNFSKKKNRKFSGRFFEGEKERKFPAKQLIGHQEETGEGGEERIEAVDRQ